MRWPCALLALLLVPASAAVAAPILALDTRPDLPGIQSTLTVGEGQPFAVDLVVAELTPGSGVQGFQVELAISGGVLTGVDVLDGGFLEAPVAELRRGVSATSILFAEVSLGSATSATAGVLARFLIEANSLGVGDLSLPVAILSAPFGTPIPLAEIRGASIAVPEPGIGSLLAAGLCALLAGIRSRVP